MRRLRVREHLISSHFVSKRNAFRNGGMGVAPFSNRNMTVRTFSGTVQSTVLPCKIPAPDECG